MPFTTRYIFIASMDVEPDKEALFHEVYDREHVPMLTQVPGVRAVHRFESESFELSIGGRICKVDRAAPQYSAVYELESPNVLVSTAWAKAVESGRWPQQVRPYTTNRRHVLQRLIVG